MPHRTLLPLLAAIASVGQVASAQTFTPVRPPIAKVATAAVTTSFSPYLAFGSLGDKPINLSLERVSFNMNAHLDGKVMFTATEKSQAYLNSPAGVPNGNYAVQLDFSSVSQPATVTISLGNTSQATCAVTSAALSCASGTFAVTTGQLDVVIAMTQGYQATLANVTINQLR